MLCDWSLPIIYQSTDVIEMLLLCFFPTCMVHSFENVCEIIPDRASEGLEKSLVGAVYEEEKRRN